MECVKCGKPLKRTYKYCPDCAPFRLKCQRVNPIIMYECPCRDENKVKHHPNNVFPELVVKLCHSCHHLEHERRNDYGLKHPRNHWYFYNNERRYDLCL